MFTSKGDGNSREGYIYRRYYRYFEIFQFGKIWNSKRFGNPKRKAKQTEVMPEILTTCYAFVVANRPRSNTYMHGVFYNVSFPPPPSSLFSMICTAFWLCLCPALISNMPAICLHFKWNRRRFIVCAISLLSSLPHPPSSAVRKGVAKVSSVASTTWSINYVLLKRILWRQIWAVQTFQSAQLQSVAATLPSPVCPVLVGCR